MSRTIHLLAPEKVRIGGKTALELPSALLLETLHDGPGTSRRINKPEVHGSQIHRPAHTGQKQGRGSSFPLSERQGGWALRGRYQWAYRGKPFFTNATDPEEIVQ